MVIIGAGECGARAAMALREQGYEGTVTLIGAEKHLPYERPPLSKHAMIGDDDPLPTTIVTETALQEKGIAFLGSAEATSIDRNARTVHFADGRALSYDKLLLATGSSPRRLPVEGNGGRCVTLRSFEDALAIRSHLRGKARVAIIGGGFIGLEIAASARLLGCDVTVIEAQGRILMRGVPVEIAEIVHAEHVERGVRFLCGTGITKIEDNADAPHIHLASGEAIEADLCVIGIGAVPNTALAQAAGLTVENGIAVNDRLRTSDPHIFAAGDCCSFPLSIYDGRRVRLEAWRNAQEQGALAAANMLGNDTRHEFVPWFWSDQYDLGIQIAGLSDEGVKTVRRDLGDGAFILFHLAEDGRLVAASGIGRGNAVAKDVRLAEMLIARRAHPPIEKLAAADVKLKALLAA
ncbi:FAD-dependent oxidoreductase [Mesorhizobium sp. SB112]|uniref:NAD(P)/FAD-dependent oxidoreductase n=1 Tax=Mesorhizobium sp. SB112 TaxID=3151853 RepID=UPI003265429D